MKKFWQMMMVGSVLGWVFALGGLLVSFEGTLMKLLWLAVLLGWGIGHPLELTMSLPIAKEKGVDLKDAIIKTLVFGFTWWVPLKQGVIEE